MNKLISLPLFIILLLPISSLAQYEPGYLSRIDSASIYFIKRNYAAAGKMYSQAFALNKYGGRQDHLYNSARAWSMAAQPDSAFQQLDKVVKRGYEEYLKIITDTALINLRRDARWVSLIAKIRTNRENSLKTSYSKLSNPDYALLANIDAIYTDDQLLRYQLDEVMRGRGPSSPEVLQYYAKIKSADSINLIKVKIILSQSGWPKLSEVGEDANRTLFLVIQHADLHSQIKLLPIIKEAAKNGDLRSTQVAILEDRIARGQGRKQTYGSQLIVNNTTGKITVQPMEDPENVDKRRASVGLGTMAEYVKQWNMIWSLEQYYKDLATQE